MPMKALGLVGGTFDRFHKGHRKLLNAGLSECKNLEIWMTSDSLAKGKDHRIESWDKRMKLIIELEDQVGSCAHSKYEQRCTHVEDSNRRA